MKAVAAAIAAMKSFSGSAEVEGFELTADDVLVTRTPKAGMVVASAGAVVVGLETSLTPELVAEGLAREFVSHVQAMRKEADFEVTQRIALRVEADAEMRAALEAHRGYVTGETLSLALDFGEVSAEATDLNGHAVKIAVAKAEP
jgi:isoleucyl-tRNA synthetase